MKEARLYRIIRPIFYGIMKVLYRPTIVGCENIPKTGAVVIAGNHKSNLDCVMVGMTTKRTVHFLAKKELHVGFKRHFFNAMGTIPVDRSKHDKNVRNKAEEILSEGKVIGIFPEGKFNTTKDLVIPFKYGAVSMASKTDTLIVPFSITGKYRIFRKGVKIELGHGFKVTGMDLTEANGLLMDKVKELLRKNM